jgi:NADH-quinone oxidoreductase subunit C
MAKPATPPDTPAAAGDPITEAALALVQKRFPDAVVASETGGAHPWIRLTPESLRDVCQALKDDAQLAMDCCHLISGVDWIAEKELEAVYHLCSYARRPDAAYRKRAVKNDPWLCLKVRVPREAPEVPTVMDIWTGADWHERETFDLVGIRFTGRRELRRILLPEDWPGHPLQKDWVYPASYHGIPIVPPEGL